jgi:hypothetical protein
MYPGTFSPTQKPTITLGAAGTIFSYRPSNPAGRFPINGTLFFFSFSLSPALAFSFPLPIGNPILPLYNLTTSSALFSVFSVSLTLTTLFHASFSSPLSAGAHSPEAFSSVSWKAHPFSLTCCSKSFTILNFFTMLSDRNGNGGWKVKPITSGTLPVVPLGAVSSDATALPASAGSVDGSYWPQNVLGTFLMMGRMS